MASCPDHKLSNEAYGRSQAGARPTAGCYTVMTVEALAAYISQPSESVKALLLGDTDAQT